MSICTHRQSPASISILTAIVLSGCSTTPVNLNYDASSTTVAPTSISDSVQLVSVTDDRKHAPNWLGAIRGGFGNPLKTLETPVPVSEVVKSTFEDALKARQLLAADQGRFNMSVNINQFDCNQYVRREAHVRFFVQVVDAGTGRSTFQKLIAVDKVTGDLITLDAGIFASVEDLRAVANEALQEAVDQALSDPELLRSLEGAS